MHIGTGELIVVLVVALIIFGPSKLPALGKMAGKAVGTLQQLGRTAGGRGRGEKVRKEAGGEVSEADGERAGGGACRGARRRSRAGGACRRSGAAGAGQGGLSSSGGRNCQE